MKAHVIFNVLSQLLILFISINLYFDSLSIKLLYSLFLISVIFIPSIIEFNSGLRLKKKFHYIVTILTLILFSFLIAF